MHHSYISIIINLYLIIESGLVYMFIVKMQGNCQITQYPDQNKIFLLYLLINQKFIVVLIQCYIINLKDKHFQRQSLTKQQLNNSFLNINNQKNFYRN
ncbi:hypothetical protein pb186bvf_004020 [Paramecium bursaria]